MATQARLAWLPIGFWDGVLIDNHQGRGPRPQRDCKIRRRELLEVEVDHDVLGDLAPLRSPVLKAIEPVLHVGKPAFEASGEGFIHKR